VRTLGRKRYHGEHFGGLDGDDNCGRRPRSIAIHNAITRVFVYMTYYRRYSDEPDLVCDIEGVMV
jgi:hypothetical protein